MLIEVDGLVCRYRVTLLNELYYLVAGGTVWTGRSRTIASSGQEPLFLTVILLLFYMCRWFGSHQWN